MWDALKQMQSSLMGRFDDAQKDMKDLRGDVKNVQDGLATLTGRVSKLENADSAGLRSPPRPSKSLLRPGSPKSPSGPCFKCGQHGHFARECPLATPNRADGDDNWRKSTGRSPNRVSFGMGRTMVQPK